MPDQIIPIIVLTEKGSIEVRAASGRCIAEGCRKMGGNMISFVVHNVEYDQPQGFTVCGNHFALAVGRMLAGGEPD